MLKICFNNINNMKRVLFAIVASAVIILCASYVSTNYFIYDSMSDKSRPFNIFSSYSSKLISETNTVSFRESRVADGTLEYGQSKVVSEGANGEIVAKYKVDYINGVEISRVKVGEEAINMPTDRVIAVGTKVVWRCYDTTSYDRNPYNDNKCVSNTGESIYVPDSKTIRLDPSFTPSLAGDPYYNSF